MKKLVDWVMAHGTVIAHAGATLLLAVILVTAPRCVVSLTIAIIAIGLYMLNRTPQAK